MVSSLLVACALLRGAVAEPATKSSSCYETAIGAYSLKWKAEGASFFDDFHFATGAGATLGSALYLDQQAALANNVIEAHSDHAILRVAKTDGWRRQSAFISTRQHWDRFLTVLKFNHVPYGSGVWPAFWSNGEGTWPDSGEVDYLEYANDEASKISMHVGKSNKCKLSNMEVNKCGSFPDENGEDYDCFTYYDKVNESNLHLGCGPTSSKAHHTGAGWANRPGVMAAERTDDYMKIFYIPEAEIPKDLNSDMPDPSGWDRWVVSYLPFAASEKRHPGSCSNPSSVLKPQHFTLNIEMCGDWAGYTWWPSDSDPDATKWRNKKLNGDCKRSHYGGSGDCCTEYLAQSSMDSYLQDRASWNVSYMKIYQLGPAPPSPPTPPSPTPCTAADKDPYGTGSEVPCCDSLQKVLKDWDSDGNYHYKCVATPSLAPKPTPSPRPSSPPPTPNPTLPVPPTHQCTDEKPSQCLDEEKKTGRTCKCVQRGGFYFYQCGEAICDEICSGCRATSEEAMVV